MKKVQCLFSLFIIICAIFSGCCADNGTDDSDGVTLPFTLDGDIVIEDCFLYSGAFPEDGSFTQKNDIPALKVKNNSSSALQLVRINAVTDKREMLFEITTLPAGATVIVLEKNANTFSKNETITQFTVSNRINFEKSLALNEDIFNLTAHSGVFNIENKTNADITSDIYVYYKKKDAQGNYFGGITFRTKAHGLKAGELKQLPASNFSTDDSEVLFIDYAEE